MHDKLKILLDRIKMPDEYYKYFNNGKILKLVLDSSRKNGVFVIEIDELLNKEITNFIDKNIKNGFPDMNSIRAEFIVKNIDYNNATNYYDDAILNSTLTKPMRELFFGEKSVCK